MGIRSANCLPMFGEDPVTPGIHRKSGYGDDRLTSISSLMPAHAPRSIPAATGKPGRFSYIELLCQTRSTDDLDTRIRINLQESLIQFIKDEKKWTSLPIGEQNKLLQRLTTRSNESNPFAERISVKCQDDKGNLITRQANLLLDATRNKNLSHIFDQIINQQIALVFYEQFCFGIVEHLEKLIDLESKVVTAGEAAESASAMTMPIHPVDLQDNLLPLSPRDLELIRENGLGIMINLIPRFLRLPLNKLYYAMAGRSTDFPSMALQFYLDGYYSTKRQRPNASPELEEKIRTLFTKSFYAIIRLGGLSMEQLRLPEATRDERFQFLTVGDEDASNLMGSKILVPYQQSIKQRLEKTLELERQLRQRREVKGPAVKVELDLERVMEDIFQIYRDQEGDESETEEDFLTRTAWLPESRPKTLSDWDKQVLGQYLERVLEESYLNQISKRERRLIQRWTKMAETEFADERTYAQLEAIEMTDPHVFTHELRLRLAERHRVIMEQNREVVVEQVVKQITRMLRVGSITPEMVIRERYDSFHQDVLPYIYYFTVTNAKGETLWIESPYPLSKLAYLIERVETITREDGSPLADTPSLAIAKQLMEGLLQVEGKNSEAEEPEIEPESSPVVLTEEFSEAV